MSSFIVAEKQHEKQETMMRIFMADPMNNLSPTKSTIMTKTTRIIKMLKVAPYVSSQFHTSSLPSPRRKIKDAATYRDKLRNVIFEKHTLYLHEMRQSYLEWMMGYKKQNRDSQYQGKTQDFPCLGILR